MQPETRYARLGDLHLAYQVLGDGPPDILLLDQWFGHVEAQWDVPPMATLRERLASFGRLIMFDKRGTGLSDRDVGDSTLDERMDDLRAVLDAAGSRRAAILGYSEGGPLAMMFAANGPTAVVRFWIGCGTKTTAGSKPSESLCAVTPSTNSVVTMLTPGRPRLSRL